MDLNEVYKESFDRVTALYVLHVAGQILSENSSVMLFSGLMYDVRKCLTEMYQQYCPQESCQ